MNDQSLRDYLADIGRIPLLTPAQEIILGREVQAWMADKESDNPCPRIERRGKRAKNHMVNANLRLVVSIAKKFANGTHTLSLMDLIQAGNLGLIRGVERFDPERGYRCSTYFYWWVRQGITRHIDECGSTIRIPTTQSDTAAKARRVASELSIMLGRTPTRAELADEMGMKQDELERLLLVSAGCYSLDAPLPGVGDDGTMLRDVLAAVDVSTPPDDPQQAELLARIQALPQGPVPWRSQLAYLIRARHGIGQAPRTAKELAAQLGVTSHRIHQQLRHAELLLRRNVSRQAAARPGAPGGIPGAAAHVVQPELPWPPARTPEP